MTVTVDGDERVRRVTDENDFFSRNSPYTHVGLDDADGATLAITWPDGTERELEVDAGQRLRITPDGETVLVDLDGSTDG